MEEDAILHGTNKVKDFKNPKNITLGIFFPLVQVK